MTRMKKKYLEEVAPALMEKFQYKSTMQIPKIDKIVVTVGCGDCKDNAKALEGVIKEISAITGQHAVATAARKSVANFKLREGMKVGVKVTLHQDRMWAFLARLFNVALPRVRDFRSRLLLSSPPASTTAARSAAVPMPTCATTASAVSASASWLIRARSPVCARLLSDFASCVVGVGSQYFSTASPRRLT